MNLALSLLAFSIFSTLFQCLETLEGDVQSNVCHLFSLTILVVRTLRKSRHDEARSCKPPPAVESLEDESLADDFLISPQRCVLNEHKPDAREGNLEESQSQSILEADRDFPYSLPS